MPPAAANTPVWSATGDDAILLFRDLYFEKYPKGTPASVAWEDLTRPYGTRGYRKETFYRHYKTFVNKVDTFKQFGTGLKPAFKAKCRLDEPPIREERAANVRQAHSERDDNESQDETYEDSEADDSTLSGFVVESYLGNLKLDDEDYNDIKKNIPNKKTQPMPRSEEKSLLSPSLVECPGGMLAGRIPLLSGVEYEFTLSKDFTSVVQKAWVPEPYLDAKQLYYRHGLNEQNKVVAAVQEQIDKQKKATKTNETGKHYIETTLFSFDEVEPYFLDYQGNQLNKVFEGKNRSNVIWGYFFLKKKKGDTAFSPPARVDRDHRRFRDDGDGGGADQNNRNVFPNNTNTNFAGSNQQHQFQMNGFNMNQNGFGAPNQFQGQVAFSQYPSVQFPAPAIPYQHGATQQQSTVPHMGTMQPSNQLPGTSAAAWGHVNNGGYNQQVNPPSGIGAGGLQGGTSGWTHHIQNTMNNNIAPNQRNFLPNAPVVHFGNNNSNVVHHANQANIPTANANVAANIAPAPAIQHAAESAGNNYNNNNAYNGSNDNAVQNNSGGNQHVRIIQNPDEVAQLLRSRTMPDAYPVDQNVYRDLTGPSPISVDETLESAVSL